MTAPVPCLRVSRPRVLPRLVSYSHQPMEGDQHA
jgi:hypothetical protein